MAIAPQMAKIKNEFPVEDRLDGIVEALKELEEREDE